MSSGSGDGQAKSEVEELALSRCFAGACTARKGPA